MQLNKISINRILKSKGMLNKTSLFYMININYSCIIIDKVKNSNLIRSILSHNIGIVENINSSEFVLGNLIHI